MVSAPPPPAMVSSPSPPAIVSAAEPPVILSSPAPPSMFVDSPVSPKEHRHQPTVIVPDPVALPYSKATPVLSAVVVPAA